MMRPPPAVATKDDLPGPAELQRVYGRRITRRDERYGIPLSVQEVAEWLRFQVKDSRRFEVWLNEHSKQQRSAIIAYLKKKESQR